MKKPPTLQEVGKRTDIYRLDRQHIVIPEIPVIHPPSLTGRRRLDGTPVETKRFNVRQEFGDLDLLKNQIIAAKGLRLPLLGHWRDGKFHVTDGERRLRAIDLAVKEGHKELGSGIPIKPEPKDYTDEQRTLDLLFCAGGKPLEMIEQAEAFRRLRDEFKLPVKAIAEKAGVTQQAVYDCFALIDAPAPVQQAVKDGKVSATLAATVAKESSTPAEAVEKIEKGIQTAKAEGKTKATARHIQTKRGKKKNDLEDAKRDLDKRKRDDRMHTEVSDGVDSVAKLRQIVEAVPRSRADFNRMDALEFIIDYLLGSKSLPDAINFFRE